jgi:hypothetical protein
MSDALNVPGNELHVPAAQYCLLLDLCMQVRGDMQAVSRSDSSAAIA